MTAVDRKPLAFPLRVAAIDVGSNALRMLAAEFSDDLNYAVLASERFPLRLGHDVFLTGKMSAESMRKTVECLAGFHARAVELGVGLSRAIATSAVRESENAEELLFQVRDRVGIDLERISGYEEARLVHLAVRRKVRMDGGQWVIADLGGGSVEVSLVDAKGILWSESHNMGSVRLLEELAGAAEDPGRFAKLLTEYVATLRVPSAARGTAPSGLVATGGNIEALLALAGASGGDGVGVLRIDDLKAIIEKLANLSYAERMKQMGLRADRADVILPAALVFERLAGLVGVREILVPQVGLKEGIAFDLVDGLSRREDLLDRQTLEPALGLGRKYLFDEPHALQVSRLALSLFDQLKKVHRLGPGERRILMAAGILHDVGSFISLKGHHKHTLYIVMQSELPGFSPEEMRLVANVARYHRKTSPAPHHPFFTGLSSADRDRVWKLASILRTADALDREHLQRVTDVHVSVEGNTARLTLRGSGDLLLERWALERKIQMLCDYFGLKTTVRVQR
jgi:exopolyphosphatase/guanosine-5'-triphosphate,3'-diphosphate pyrophosphatase